MQPSETQPCEACATAKVFGEQTGRAATANKPSWRMRLWLGYLACALAAGTLALTGLVPRWGLWYSTRLDYREQTEELLQGRTGLSTGWFPEL